MLSTSTDGLFPAKKLMMTALSSPVSIGFVPHTGATVPAMTACHVARFAFPAAVLCWFEIGGPGTTNSKCIAIGTSVPHVDVLQPVSLYFTIPRMREQSDLRLRLAAKGAERPHFGPGSRSGCGTSYR